MNLIRIGLRKGKEETNIVCLYFIVKYIGSSFIGDTFKNRRKSTDSDKHYIKGEGKVFFFINLFKLVDKWPYRLIRFVLLNCKTKENCLLFSQNMYVKIKTCFISLFISFSPLGKISGSWGKNCYTWGIQCIHSEF